MGFLDKLRMSTLTRGMTGTPYSDIPRGPDPMLEIINQYQNLLAQQPQIGGIANSMVGLPPAMPNLAPNGGVPLRFGGVTSQSNPGAEILARSARSANQIYEGYKDPLPTAEDMGPSRDEIFTDKYFGRKNAETTANANAGLAKERLEIARQNADSRGWKTVTITDPKDPSKQINVRMNEVTGEVKPIEIPGVITRTGSAADMQKDIDNKNLKATQRQAVKDKAETTLAALNEIANPETNQLTDEALRAVGLSSWGNIIPTTKGYSGAKSIKRLKDLLTLDLIGEMKAQSKTGATGFGALNLKELGVLEGAASKLDAGLDEETFQEEIKRIRQKLTDILTDAAETQIAETPNAKDVSTGKAPLAPEGFEYVRRPDNKGWTAIRKVGG